MGRDSYHGLMLLVVLSRTSVSYVVTTPMHSSLGIGSDTGDGSSFELLVLSVQRLQLFPNQIQTAGVEENEQTSDLTFVVGYPKRWEGEMRERTGSTTKEESDWVEWEKTPTDLGKSD
jgi:hypothetical protein